MTTDLYGTLAELAAVGSVPDADTLAAVAAGLSGVPIDPWAEWYGIPTQHPAPSESLLVSARPYASGLALALLPRRQAWS
jgi:hypothetical protein